MEVIGELLAVGMPVPARRRWVEIDAGRHEFGFGRFPVAPRIISGQIAPASHRPPGAAARRARYACTLRV
jgi:hypothetical protein